MSVFVKTARIISSAAFIAFGIPAVVVALVPALLVWATDLLGLSLPSNLLFFVASVVLLLLTLQHSYELGRLEERTRTLAEEVGLLRLELQRATGETPTEAPPTR